MRTTAPLVTGINAVFLYVADLDRSIAFYREVLGIPIARHPRNPDWAEHTFPTGIRVAFHTAKPGGVLGSGSIHVNLEVEDIDEAAERCRAAGLRIDEFEKEFWGGSFRITDPDGYTIDLFQRPA